jgi:hypothetical protein
MLLRQSNTAAQDATADIDVDAEHSKWLQAMAGAMTLIQFGQRIHVRCKQKAVGTLPATQQHWLSSHLQFGTHSSLAVSPALVSNAGWPQVPRLHVAAHEVPILAV